MFIKFASLESLSVIEREEDFNNRQADRKIVQFDPDFVYVVVRAVTADRPNNNGDSFPSDELTRIDPLLNRPVFESFISKGVFVNHQNTDDPLHAKGVVLDARYVTAKEDDKHIELLLGIDRQKDPIFASSVERGLINKYSMGASVQYTICSICGNKARAKEEFCEHIAKGKMREFDGKLAFEKCFGVVYNEISAVSDPADETAQLLEKIAKNSQNKNARTVVIREKVNAEIARLENALMKKSIRKMAQPADFDKAPDMPAEDVDVGLGDEIEPEVEEKAEVAEVLRVVTDLVEEKMAPEEAVEAIESIVGGGEMEPEPPGEEIGEPEPKIEEFGPAPASTTNKRRRFSQLIKNLAREYSNGRKSMDDKHAADSKKVDNQYPYDKRQGDPKQHHTKPFKGRPSSDFAKDKKDYAKLYNITAEFKASDDKREAKWVVADNDIPKYVVTGARAFGDYLDSQFERFASEDYGQALVEAILEDGLDETMDRVNAQPIPIEEKKEEAQVAKASQQYDTDKLLKAAERKAADLADEKIEEYKCRFIEGLSVALKAQGKNVVDNPLKCAAYEVLTSNGLDGNLAEKIIDNEVVALHVDAAIKKAQEYAEMTPDAFEQVKAYVDGLPIYNKVASEEKDENVLRDMEIAARKALSKRASVGVPILNKGGEVLNRNSADDRISNAVRAYSRISQAPSTERTYGKRRA